MTDLIGFMRVGGGSSEAATDDRFDQYRRMMDRLNADMFVTAGVGEATFDDWHNTLDRETLRTAQTCLSVPAPVDGLRSVPYTDSDETRFYGDFGKTTVDTTVLPNQRDNHRAALDQLSEFQSASLADDIDVFRNFVEQVSSSLDHLAVIDAENPQSLQFASGTDGLVLRYDVMCDTVFFATTEQAFEPNRLFDIDVIGVTVNAGEALQLTPAGISRRLLEGL